MSDVSYVDGSFHWHKRDGKYAIAEWIGHAFVFQNRDYEIRYGEPWPHGGWEYVGPLAPPDSKAILVHRRSEDFHAALKVIAGLGPMARKAQSRPPNYNDLPPAEQWAVDKELGILDWDGSNDT